MSLLGIDAGTTGCKAAVFSETGQQLAIAYEEYDIAHPHPGWDELDAVEVWGKIKQTIGRVTAAVRDAGAASAVGADPIRALAVSSMGEALVPVRTSPGGDRCILGPSILLSDSRGAEYLPRLRRELSDERLYAINGNTLGNHYSLTKLMWIREHQPERYAAADKFLPWSSFVGFMLGADPIVDYTLANRTLLFDLAGGDWSPELLAWGGIARAKLPATVPSGTVIGQVARRIAGELGLSPGIPIVAGSHDQCANAVGCGAIREGLAVCGMGTFLCITPVFTERRPPDAMVPRGLNTEHHAAPGKYVSFIWNQGGILVKWYRDTFAAAEHRQARAAGRDVYPELFAELPPGPSGLMVLPHFTATGTPEFVTDTCGIIAGLRIETPRGAILKGILEGTTFYLKACVETLPAAEIPIHEYRATGGGSKSDAWVQLCADILGQPFARPQVTEAGALGAAIMAGVGAGVFASYEAGVAAMVRLERHFEPNAQQQRLYAAWFERYRPLWPLMQEYLRGLTTPVA